MSMPPPSNPPASSPSAGPSSSTGGSTAGSSTVPAPIPTRAKPRSPSMRPMAPNSLMKDIHAPVEPSVLADAISKLDTLKTARTPSNSSPAHSSNVSGASSPNAMGAQLEAGMAGMSMTTAATAAATAGATAATATGAPVSQDPRAMSAPGTPHFGAQTDMLRTLDESTKVIRQNSKAPQRAPSVSGIGTVVEKPDYSEAKIVVAMVGLPARGKSYLSNKLMRYLRWLEYNVEVFNVGQLRRSKARAAEKIGGGKADHSASYFSHSNEAANQIREQLANESLESLIDWLKKGEGNVGIMDATNSTFDRREKIRHRVAQDPSLQLLFLESFCDDPAVIAVNVALKARSGDPDYAGMSQQEAEADFRKRIQQYESVYQTITEPNIAFCRILNVGQQVTINRIEGYLQSRIAFYLMNLHLKPRSIYLSRHGESMYNVEGKIGGDSDLSPRGWEYAKALPDLVKKNIGDLPLEVWTSTLQRTIQTGSMLPFDHKTWKSLDELDAGVCDGMTYEEIEKKYPEDYESRDEDKFNYRYRGGESYRDVVIRLEPVIMELERQENILIIGHQAILRCLYAYFMSLSQEELPYINVPLHTLIKITPMAYGCQEERYHLPIDAVDTHRPKPKSTKAERRKSAQGAEGAEPTAHKNSIARDYYGDSEDHKTAHMPPPELHAALEKVAEAGETTPKAAAVL